MTDLERVAALPWFARLEQPVRDALLLRGRWARRGAGEWLYGEGDEETGIVAVLEGGLHLYAQAQGRREVLFSVVPPGGVIGQSLRLGGGPRLVTAICAADTLVFQLPDRALRQTLEMHPALWLSVSALAYEQLRTVIEMIADHVGLPPRARLISRLVALSELSPRIRISQSDVAEMIGVSRKAVNGWLGGLERAGRIVRGYGFIEVRDRAGLRRLLEDE